MPGVPVVSDLAVAEVVQQKLLVELEEAAGVRRPSRPADA